MSRNTKYNNLWIEKYRPSDLEYLIMDAEVKSKVKKWLNDGDIPNLLLLSKTPGTGKSSLARIIVNNLIPDEVDLMELNGSSQGSRGIGIIEEIESFLGTPPIFSKIKLVYIDEFDGFTDDAQKALRALIEKYSETGRFIFTANYIHKILEPIQSRTTIIEFKNLPKDECKRIIHRILKEEEVKYDTTHVDKIIETMYPDVRSTINTLQRMIIESDSGKEITENTLGIALGTENIIVELIIQALENINNGAILSELSKTIMEKTKEEQVDYILIGKLLFEDLKKPMAKMYAAEFVNSLNKIIEPRLALYATYYKILGVYSKP